MWSRSELKKIGQKTFNKNYWKCVLTALILALVTGSGAGVHVPASASPGALVGSSTDEVTDELSEDMDGSEDDTDAISANIDMNVVDGINIDIEHADEGELSGAGKTAAAMIFGFVFVVLFLLIFAIVLLLDAFILNPLELGCDRFFYKNLDEPAEMAEIAYGFDNGYRNVAKILFLRDIYTMLWSLLFIIPGIIKAYEYRMIPYILAENPDMDKNDVFALSKEMMTGQKWKTFILDLSFIGWDILSMLTIGLLGIFYVAPYKRATHAALYDTLKKDHISAIDTLKVIEQTADTVLSGDSE